jgi:two-component system chemotaxis sensor kinase CheA
MSNKHHQNEAVVNRIAAQIPLVDKTDFSAIMAIMAGFEELSAETDTPKALVTQAKRGLALANHIIMAETDFDTGCKKLFACIEIMQKSLAAGLSPVDIAEKEKTIDTSAAKTNSLAPPLADNSIPLDETQAGQNAEPQEPIADDIKDLLVKFASSQSSVLEDFESYILENEKGDPQAKGAIKRVLHTWKGEFGVLDLSGYSKFLHDIEERIEQNAFSTDNLFKLKDLLAAKLAKFATGANAPLSETEKKSICETAAAAAPPTTGAPPPVAFPPKENDRKVAAPPVRSTVLSPVSTEQHTTAKDILSCDTSLLNDFITEARDHLHAAETLLLELETDPGNKENLNTIFRAWHTLKGVAGFLGLKEIASLAHKMESQMDLARKGELVLGPGPIDVFLEGNDCLKALIAAIEPAMKGEPFLIPENYDALINKLSTHLSGDISAPATTSKGADKKMGELLVESGTASPAEVENALAKQAGGDTRKIGEILLDESAVPARAVGNALVAQSTARQMKNIEETIRVPVNRIDQLVDSIGEAVIAQSMVNANPLLMSVTDQALATKIAHANTIMRQIQELAMSLRMVSIKSTFQKMARLARDLSKKCDRDLEFVTEGEDTELDKSVVENIGDPLIHMIRNSIDHGIEPREERLTSGKPAKALVKLRAFHRAGSIFIEVMDDGKGLDKDAIFKKAASKGLCKEGANLSDQEIFQFIFLPGFSTAKVVTDVSGRGVGMDVVRRNIESLRGSCEISSVWGKGTTFSIRLPLTLAIVDGMVVRSGTDKYIIPTLAILESLKATAEQVQTVLGKGKMLSVRGELISMVHLGALLQRANEMWDVTNGIVMIVEDMLGKKIGIFLDEIIGQQQVVIKTLGDGMHDIPGVTGGAIMSDGTVSLILDVGGIVKLSGEGNKGSGSSPSGEELQSAA